MFAFSDQTMTQASDANVARAHLSTAAWTGIAFAFWLLCMGALAPGNIRNALDAGVAPDPIREVVRLCAAGLLGASGTPLLLLLVRRASGAEGWTRRTLAFQGVAIIALSIALITVSCFLATWFFSARAWPSLAEVLEQIFANTLLLVLCNASLLGAMHAVPRLFRSQVESIDGWPDRLTVGERGRLTVIDLETVEWIEAQGNYQAIYADDGVHLYRETSARLQAALNPSKFIRIHRKYLVARDRVSSAERLPSGDATIVMQSGARLRQSRQYRNSLREALNG